MFFMNFFDHKDLGNHLLQLCPKFVKHPVFTLPVLYHIFLYNYWYPNCILVVRYPNDGHRSDRNISLEDKNTWLNTFINVHVLLVYYLGIYFGATAPSPPIGPGSPHSWCLYIAYNDAPQSVGLLWTSDQLILETSTWQHTAVTRDKHPYPRWDSNPQYHQVSGRRPYTLDRLATGIGF